MNTISCRIKLNEYQDIAGVEVTPAEAVVLRYIHHPSLATQAKTVDPKDTATQKACWGFLSNVKASKTAATEVPNPKYDPENAKSKEPEFTSRERTPREEVARLRMKYNVRAKSGAQGSHILDDLWPGENPELPKTFDEIGLEVEPPKAAKPAKTAKEVEEAK